MAKKSRMKMCMVFFMVLLMVAGLSGCRSSQNYDSVPGVDEADEE